MNMDGNGPQRMLYVNAAVDGKTAVNNSIEEREKRPVLFPISPVNRT